MSDMSDTTAASWDQYFEEYRPPFLLALIFVPPIVPFFWKYHVGVNNKAVSIGYSYYFHQEIERSHIVNAEAIEHINGLKWGGWGYRSNLQGEKGYITKNSAGIRLVYKNKEKESVVVFNCEEAEKVCKLLNTPVVNAVVH